MTSARNTGAKTFPAFLRRVAPWLVSVFLSLSCTRPPAHPATSAEPPANDAWPKVSRERWAASLYGYESPLRAITVIRSGATQGEFTDYVSVIHDRLHPIFTDGFLASLEELPADHPLNRETLNALVEVVLNGDGKIVRLGILHSSGVEAFDVGVLEAVWRASPFGKPPREIVSIDGRVYVHWRLWREPYYACSTRFGKAHVLRGAKR
jgi:TonB family protein